MRKDDFPIFKQQPELVYLDSAATALKPQVVIDAVTDYYSNYSANIHRGIYPMSEKATDAYEKARKQVAELLQTAAEQIIFTSGTTAGINQIAQSYEEILNESEEILVSRSEHHANLLPWQNLAKKTGAKLIVIDNEDLTAERIVQHVNSKTKIFALAHVSNVLGVINDIQSISKAIRSVNPGAVIAIDGAQAVPHISVDVEDLDVDYYAFSGHKIYGPTGIGALWVKAERFAELKPLTYGGGAIKTVTETACTLLDGPHGFEAGTPPIAEAIGMGEAAKYVKDNLADDNLADQLYEKLAELDFIEIIGQSENRIPLVSFTVKNVHAHDVAQFLADRSICVRAGHHCTMPLHKHLDIQASVRASLGIYNDASDIDKLVSELTNCYKELGKL